MCKFDPTVTPKSKLVTAFKLQVRGEQQGKKQNKKKTPKHLNINLTKTTASCCKMNVLHNHTYFEK